MSTALSRSVSLHRTWAAAASVVLVLALLASPAGAHRWPQDAPSPGPVYLSLGDSMAFGIQFDRLFEMLDAGTYTPDAFDTGYTDFLAARMRALRPDQETVNLSCPGETASTMISGGCFFTTPEPEGPGLALHTSYQGSQLDAAVAFLRSHRDEVDPITLAIGGNDVINVIAEACNFDASCVTRSGIREQLGRDLDHIVQALRDAAPGAVIILVAFYNPFTLDGPASSGLWHRHYTKVQQAAAARHGVLLVDLSDLVDKHNACELTFMCSSGDPHPTDLGYRLIADEVFEAAGYE